MRHNKYIIRIFLIQTFLFWLCLGVVFGTNNKDLIKGNVHNQNGIPLAGVVVRSDDGENRTLTDVNGNYNIAYNSGDESLVFSFIGFESKTVTINNNRQVDVELVSEQFTTDNVVQLGYSSQKRDQVTGAVSTVSGEELKKSPVANLSMTFAGRLPGLFTNETYSELGRTNTNLFVRGVNANRATGPLVIIDGIICAYNSNESLEYITPSEIESVTVLKDASTQALYGIQGANGVIVITTKKGELGKLKVNVRFDEAFQQMTTKPDFTGSAEYARLRNEAAYNDGQGLNYFFSDEQIAKYASGEDLDLYPNNNWYNMFLRDFAKMQRLGVDLSGGSEKIKYFTNVNIMHQGSQFKTDQDDYETAPNFDWANFRSNIDAKINNYLSAYLQISGNIKRERVPGGGSFSSDLYSSLFNIPSTVYGPVTPTVVDQETGETSGNEVITTNLVDNPTYGMLNRSGYTRYTVTNIYSQFGLNLDMNFLLPGLKASGIVAYQTNSVNGLLTTQNYERWVRSDDPDNLSFTKKGSNNNTTLAYEKSSSYYYHLTYKGLMDYQKDFGAHSVSAMAYMFYQNLSKADVNSPWCLPYNRVSSGFEATYAYDNRYLLKFDLGYSGSGQYARGSRYISTPAIAGAWVVSNEKFMKDIAWLNYFKLRASYGKTANDIDNQGRFAYLDNVTFGNGGPIGYLRFNIDEKQVGNPNYSPEKDTKQNYGIDATLFGGLSLSFDLFKEHLNNMVVNAAAFIPSYQGVPLSNYPTTNAGEYENKGYEISVEYQKAISDDFSVNLGGNITYAENKEINSMEALKSEDYAYRNRTEGYSYGQKWGYLVDYSNGNGFFNFEEEIAASGLTYSGTVRPGDLKFQDLNNDKVIDERDQAPIGTGEMPRYYYGISGGLNYKSIDFSFLLQGVGKWSTIHEGIGIYETSYDGVFGSLHRNAWTEQRWLNDEKITAPALSRTNSVSHVASDYYEYNRAYLRLKNVEVSYTFPDKISQKLMASEIRIILSGQNLLTWDKMKSNDFGPEGTFNSIPVYRVYNAGLSIRF